MNILKLGIMKKYLKKEVLIAISVIVSVGILYWGINYLKGANLFTPTNYYKVSYEQVNGLKVSAPITINGFQVGLVNDIVYDYENNEGLIVELSLDEKLKLPVGTEAVIVTDMLGTSSMVLNLGKEGTEFVEKGGMLPGKIQGGLLDSVSKDLMPSLSVLVPKIDSILTSLNTVLANPALNESVSRLNQITSNLENVTAQLDKSMSKNVSAILNNANDITAELKVVSENLTNITNELNAVPLDSTMNNVNAIASNLKEITDNMNGKDSSLGLLLNDNGLYNHADQTILSLDSLLKDIKANPKRYINVKVF